MLVDRRIGNKEVLKYENEKKNKEEGFSTFSAFSTAFRISTIYSNNVNTALDVLDLLL